MIPQINPETIFINNPRALLIPVIGVSGVGKSSIVQAVLKSPIVGRTTEFLISHTQKKPRSGEKDRLHYYFVTDEIFQDMIIGNEFAEYNEVYPGSFYGTSYAEIARVVTAHNNGITDLDVDGAQALKQKFPNNVFSIFIQPQSIEQALQQLVDRGETEHIDPEKLKLRTARFEYEMSHKNDFDLLVTNVSGKPEIDQHVVIDAIHKKIYQGNQVFTC
jgi:guanylate kinase